MNALIAKESPFFIESGTEMIDGGLSLTKEFSGMKFVKGLTHHKTWTLIKNKKS